jgi:hypothetical protein
MNVEAATVLAEAIFLFLVGLLFGAALRKAVVPSILLFVGLVVAGYLQLSLPFNPVRILYDSLTLEEKAFFMFGRISGIEWWWIAGIVIGFLFPFGWPRPLLRLMVVPRRASNRNDKEDYNHDLVEGCLGRERAGLEWALWTWTPIASC